MKTVYELLTHWTQYGKPGGTALDFDVFRGTTVIGRYDTREAAEQELRRRQTALPEFALAIHIEEEFDEYEIRAVEVM